MFFVSDLTFHCQCLLLQVRYQLPCSDGFACLGSHPFLVNRMGASFVGVVVSCQKLGFPSCPGRLTHLSPDLCTTIGCVRITTLERLAASYHGLKWS